MKTRTHTVNTLHIVLTHLVAGGASRDLSADRAAALLRSVRPHDTAGKSLRMLAVDLVAASPRKFMLWKRYCIVVRISPNWPPSPSCKALAAAGSGSSGRISLMSCRVRSFGGRRARAFVAGGYQLSLLKCVRHCQSHPQQVAHGTAVIVDRLR